MCVVGCFNWCPSFICQHDSVSFPLLPLDLSLCPRVCCSLFLLLQHIRSRELYYHIFPSLWRHQDDSFWFRFQLNIYILHRKKRKWKDFHNPHTVWVPLSVSSFLSVSFSFFFLSKWSKCNVCEESKRQKEKREKGFRFQYEKQEEERTNEEERVEWK